MRAALLLWILFCIGTLTMNGQVKVWEGTMPLAASDEGPLDENPNFDTFAELEDYPYTMRQDIRASETVHPWHGLYLENEYLKCTILPQLGGHIYTCVDKINGKPMFYANPSFKKAIIAYRGAWSAFGEEFNFPISHNWVTISPVDWAYSTAADGSASVTVGNRDRVYGMDWTVEIVLRPGSTLLEEHVTLSNYSDARHHFFWWNNAGVEVWNDSRIYYPMQFTITDGAADIDTWPVNLKGIDLSLVGNQEGVFEAFAYGSSEAFMGVYSPHTGSGVVHWADPRAVPSKKFFSWGTNSNALDWRNRLSDNHSAYVEVQSGLFRDQTIYQFLEPGQSIRFTEFWMPVRGIGSIARANLNGVVAMERTRQKGGKIALKIGFNANRAIAGAKITVSDGEKNVLAEDASLDPAVTWTHQIADLPAEKTYTFLLASANGETLLKHSEGVYDVVPRDRVKTGPQPRAQALDLKSWAEGNFLKGGTDLELRGDYLNAWDNYQSGLAKFPGSVALLKAAGRVADGLWRYQEAATLLGKAEERDSSDAETHYYRGIAETGLDHPDDARAELEAAHNSPSFQAAGGLLLAELMARQHDAGGALKVLEASCRTSSDADSLRSSDSDSDSDSDSEDLRCIEETVALERATGDLETARSLAGKSLPRYPTSLFLSSEAAKVGSNVKPAGPELDRHLAADTNRILSLVLRYNRLGLYADSLELLNRSYPAVAPEDSEPGAPVPSADPLLAYYRGFCREKLGQSGAADYAAASQMSLLNIFPSEPDEITVLHAALAVNASDASAHFLLGTLFFSKGIVDPALEEWKRAESLNPKIPSLQVSMGRVLLEVKEQPAEAAAEFQRGFQMEPNNAALYLGLNRAMQKMGKPPAQRAEMMKRFPDPANMPEPLVRALVEALRTCGRNDEANAVLAHRFLARKEGEAPLQPQK
jgi:tetratricopeptide (TPR) repeat protein